MKALKIIKNAPAKSDTAALEFCQQISTVFLENEMDEQDYEKINIML